MLENKYHNLFDYSCVICGCVLFQRNAYSAICGITDSGRLLCFSIILKCVFRDNSQISNIIQCIFSQASFFDAASYSKKVPLYPLDVEMEMAAFLGLAQFVVQNIQSHVNPPSLDRCTLYVRLAKFSTYIAESSKLHRRHNAFDRL